MHDALQTAAMLQEVLLDLGYLLEAREELLKRIWICYHTMTEIQHDADAPILVLVVFHKQVRTSVNHAPSMLASSQCFSRF